MKPILHLAAKDLKLISRDWLGLFFIIAFPIGMGLFFGLVGIQMSSGESELPLAIVDEDQTEQSKRLVELLEADGSVVTESVEREQALDDVRRGVRFAVLVIPKGFGENAGILWSPDPPELEMGTDPSRQAEAGMLEGYILKAMGQMMMDRFQNPDAMQDALDDSRESIENADGLSALQRQLLINMFNAVGDASQGFGQADEDSSDGDATDDSDQMPDFQLANITHLELGGGDSQNASEPDDEEDDSPSLTSMLRSPWDISFPSAMMWGVLGCAAGFAVSIVRERTHGTFTRLQIAPISRSQVLFGKAAACYTAVIGVVVAMTCLGMILGMRPQNFAMLAVSTLCVAYCFVGIMMTLSVIGKSEEAVAGASWGTNVIAAMFGGGMIPLAFMPDFMRPLSNISPVKWGILSLEGAIWRQFSWSELAIPCVVLIAIGTAGLAIGCTVLSRD